MVVVVVVVPVVSVLVVVVAVVLVSCSSLQGAAMSCLRCPMHLFWQALSPETIAIQSPSRQTKPLNLQVSRESAGYFAHVALQPVPYNHLQLFAAGRVLITFI